MVSFLWTWPLAPKKERCCELHAALKEAAVPWMCELVLRGSGQGEDMIGYEYRTLQVVGGENNGFLQFL